ncbi:MAG: glycoside hydrolase family 130 protein [Acidimicrobiia bacterium]|nr:glycoside hydrolase family 130 protein [Acidimicrobiia bacterium]
MTPIDVTRSEVGLAPDPRRRIAKPYLPGDHGQRDGRSRAEELLERILALSPEEMENTLQGVRDGFSGRHADLDGILQEGFSAVAHLLPDPAGVSDEMRRVIGAYFMHEYSIEGAALTNPSIVPALDQSDAHPGTIRVIVSLRAVGEGHISSIEFRTGLIGPGGRIELETPGDPTIGSRRPPVFDRALFTNKLDEMGAATELVDRALGGLSDRFTMGDLEVALEDLGRQEGFSHAVQQVTQEMHWLASSNYELNFPESSKLSERVLFPSGPSESRGMEDARFVRFTESDGSVVYYATYTAYDGMSILPQLIETIDFQTFRIATLNGRAARNKGIALFPRRIDDRYAALSRSDGESNHFMVSDHVRFWHESQRIQRPRRPWELVQIGNAGSPIETEAGWLVVTHGVGPMRRYVLGAILLDIDDPSRVIGQLEDPLLEPDETERDGYVPNVVYSCGSIVHDGNLVIAYGASDTSTSFASMSLDSVLGGLTQR